MKSFKIIIYDSIVYYVMATKLDTKFVSVKPLFNAVTFTDVAYLPHSTITDLSLSDIKDIKTLEAFIEAYPEYFI